MRIAALQMQAEAGDVAGQSGADRPGGARGGSRRRGAADRAGTGADRLWRRRGDARRWPSRPTAPGRAPCEPSRATTGIAIIAGFAERDGDTVYNSAVFVDGAPHAGVYRKSHLYGDYERGLFAAAAADGHASSSMAG